MLDCANGAAYKVAPYVFEELGAEDLLGGAADLWTKSAVFSWRGLPGQSDVWWVVDEHFGIETAVNPGAVFGIGAGRTSAKTTLYISLVMMVGVAVWMYFDRLDLVQGEGAVR